MALSRFGAALPRQHLRLLCTTPNIPTHKDNEKPAALPSWKQVLVSTSNSAASYFSKFNGTQGPQPALSGAHIVVSGLTALLGFSALALPVHFIDSLDPLYLIGPFGSSAALLYGAPDAPFSQPRNVIGGHVVSATVGVTVMKLSTMLAFGVWFSAPLAVAGSIVAMQATRTFHPPAAGTGLLAVVGSKVLHDLGFAFVLSPVAVGSTTLVLAAVVLNNLLPSRQYPKRWL